MSKYIFQFCLGGLLALLGPGTAAIAQAPTPRVNVIIEADQVQNYSLLMDQVVSAANDAISNTFISGPDQIELTVLVNRNGQILPILTADVSRNQWQQQPDVQTWARYSTSVQVLLGYAQPTRTAARRSPVRRPIIENAALIDVLD